MKKNDIVIYKFSKEEVKQQDTTNEKTGIISPEIPFDLLLKAYKDSFILSWIVDKIAKSCAGEFEDIKNDELKKFLWSINLRLRFTNLLVFWNLFLEKIKNKKGEFIWFESFLTTTVKVKQGEKSISYVQQTTSQKPFEKDSVCHIKLDSLSSKLYWDSIFTNVITQVTLLALIDQFYNILFDRWLIAPFLLFDPEWKLTDDQCKTIQVMINEWLRWLDNSFRGLTLSTKLEKMDLSSNIDHNIFNKLRTDLIKAICIWINYPYWLVVNDSSNRATADIEYQALLKEVIVPLQQEFLGQLKTQLKDIKTDKWTENDIDTIFFKSVDIKNKFEEMKTWTWYKTAGIFTANEVRKELGRNVIDGWDSLETRMTPEQTRENMEDIQKKISKIYNK